MAGRRAAPAPLHDTIQTAPANTLEARENQLIALAQDAVEQRIREGTVSAQELTALLRLGSTREKLEQEKMDHEVELLKVKKDAIEMAENLHELYGNALNAMRSYQGQDEPSMGDDDAFD